MGCKKRASQPALRSLNWSSLDRPPKAAHARRPPGLPKRRTCVGGAHPWRAGQQVHSCSRQLAQDRPWGSQPLLAASLSIYVTYTMR